jgi:hypothetical protein
VFIGADDEVPGGESMAIFRHHAWLAADVTAMVVERARRPC